MIVVKRGKEPNSLLKFRKENPGIKRYPRTDVGRAERSVCILYEEN